MLPLKALVRIDLVGAELGNSVGRFDRLGNAVGGLLSKARSRVCGIGPLEVSKRY